MLVDITIGVTSIYSYGVSSSYREKNLYQLLNGQNNMMQMKSGYTYLGHDHDLVAGQVMLFDSLSENNFGTTVTIYLIM